MKHKLAMLAIVAASITYSTPAISDGYKAGLPDDYSKFSTYQSKGQKDECLIVAKNCIGNADSVSSRVERLRNEIDKGAAVYTPEELKALQEQLNWINSESPEFSGDRI